MPRPIVDIAGQVFGRLTAIERTSSNRHGFATWLCRCSCGAEAVVSGHNLRRGGTRSCGCLARDTSRRMAATLAAKTLLNPSGNTCFEGLELIMTQTQSGMQECLVVFARSVEVLH